MSTIEKNQNDNQEFRSLIRLLDDENEFIYDNVRERFLSHGTEAMAFLREYFNSENELISGRSKEIYTLINFNILGKKMRELSYESDILEKAAFLICSYEYPDIDTDNYIMILDKMALDLKWKMEKKHPSSMSALEKIRMLNNYFFIQKGFRGNDKYYYEADNCYISRVIDRKTGIQITLSIIYILIAKRLNLPVYGVNVPGHFIVEYKDEKNEYFVDVFNSGVVISKDEALTFLRQFGVKEQDFDEMPFLHPASEREIIKRVFTNLINIYKKENNRTKTEQLKKLQSYFS